MSDETKLNQALKTAILTLLKPLVRILLRHGVSHGAFAEYAKKVYVDVATEEFTIPGRKQTVSRVSILTGLTRKEVSRLQQLAASDDLEAAERYNRTTRVISGWVNDPRYLNAYRQPLDLPLNADHPGSGPSFSGLVKQYSGDIPVQAMLTELVRVNAVEQRPDGLLRLVRRAYIPSHDLLEKVHILGTDVGELITTIDHNLDPERQPFFQRKVSIDALPAEYCARFRELSAQRAQALLEELDHWLSQYEVKDQARCKEQACKQVGMGIYYFETATPSQEHTT